MVMLREPEALDEKTWQVITDNAYQRFADELTAANRAGRTSIPDPEATAAVAIASLSYAATLRALSGRLPGNVDEDRYFGGVGRPDGQHPRVAHQSPKTLTATVFTKPTVTLTPCN